MVGRKARVLLHVHWAVTVSYPTHAISEDSAQPDSFMRCLGVAEPILYRKYTPTKQKQEKRDTRTHGPAPQSVNTTFYANKGF